MFKIEYFSPIYNSIDLMKHLHEVYNFIMEKLSHYGVVPMYIHNIADETTQLIHIFDFPCHREFHRISYYPKEQTFKYYRLPIDLLRKEELLKIEEVPQSKLVIETKNIEEIQNRFKESAELEFQSSFQ